MTDEELVLLARQGDPDAFDQLVARHQSAVFRAALAALRVREDAEEVAQDAFIRAWRALDRFRGDSSDIVMTSPGVCPAISCST